LLFCDRRQQAYDIEIDGDDKIGLARICDDQCDAPSALLLLRDTAFARLLCSVSNGERRELPDTHLMSLKDEEAIMRHLTSALVGSASPFAHNVALSLLDAALSLGIRPAIPLLEVLALSTRKLQARASH
jgi:hypothetical protein